MRAIDSQQMLDLQLEAEYIEAKYSGLFRHGTIRAKIRDWILEFVKDTKANGWNTCVKLKYDDFGNKKFVGLQPMDMVEYVYGDREDYIEKGKYYWDKLVRSQISGMQERGFPIATTSDIVGYFVPMSKDDTQAVWDTFETRSTNKRRELMQDIFQKHKELAEQYASDNRDSVDVIIEREKHMREYLAK